MRILLKILKKYKKIKLDEKLRKALKFLSYFLLIEFFVLTFLGLYDINQRNEREIVRLVEKTEELNEQNKQCLYFEEEKEVEKLAVNEWSNFDYSNYSFSFEYPSDWNTELDSERKFVGVEGGEGCDKGLCDYSFYILERETLSDNSQYYPYDRYISKPESAAEYIGQNWLDYLDEERTSRYNDCLANGEAYCSANIQDYSFVDFLVEEIDNSGLALFNDYQDLSIAEIDPYVMQNRYIVLEKSSRIIYEVGLRTNQFDPISYPRVMENPAESIANEIGENNILVDIVRNIEFGLEIDREGVSPIYQLPRAGGE